MKKVQHKYIDNYENYHDREDYFELYTQQYNNGNNIHGSVLANLFFFVQLSSRSVFTIHVVYSSSEAQWLRTGDLHGIKGFFFIRVTVKQLVISRGQSMGIIWKFWAFIP